jgi:trans-aconitate methyltransferase
MKTGDAVSLIEAAVSGSGATWADLGAGSGTFTRALVHLLGPAHRIYAVDRDARAIATLQRWAARDGYNVVAVRADFTQPLDVTDRRDRPLDGMLLANALHFVRDAEAVLARLVTELQPRRIVIVEYDRRAASPWVPYPIPLSRLPSLAAAAGLSAFTVTAERPSAYRGRLYAAVAHA